MWVEGSGPNRCVGGYIVDDKMVTVVGNVADGCTSQSSVWEGQRPSDGESCCTILKNTIIPAILCQDLAELGMDKELHRGQCPPWFISFYRGGCHTKGSFLAIIWINKWLWALLRVHHLSKPVPLTLFLGVSSTYTIKRGLVRGLPSKMAKPTYQPSYRSWWARGRGFCSTILAFSSP